jgi:hypothetical protein
MKIRIACNICNPPKYTYCSLSDKGLYRVCCSEGHESVVFIENHKFDILFESGILALIDGYGREAVSSIASSIERFYELYIKAICLKNGVYFNKITESWNKIAVQSERQLGAFIFVYLLENKTRPKLLSDKLIKFRNNVIHRGYIPSDDEVIKYAWKVAQIISTEYLNMKNSCNDLRQYTIGIDGIESGAFDEENSGVVAQCESTLLTRIIDLENIEEKFFEAEIKNLRSERNSFLLNY